MLDGRSCAASRECRTDQSRHGERNDETNHQRDGEEGVKIADVNVCEYLKDHVGSDRGFDTGNEKAAFEAMSDERGESRARAENYDTDYGCTHLRPANASNEPRASTSARRLHLDVSLRCSR
jgi:hypothetical protein